MSYDSVNSTLIDSKYSELHGKTTSLRKSTPGQPGLDVSDRRRPVHEQLESESRSRALEEALADLILCVGPTGDCRASIPAQGLQRWGLPNQVLGENIFSLLPRDSGETIRSNARTARNTNKTQVFRIAMESWPGEKELEGRLSVSDDGELMLVVRDVTEETSLKTAVLKLLSALHSSRERTVKALLPACAWCNKVRNDQGDWKELGDFLQEMPQSDVTHGICPDCQFREIRRYIADSGV